RRGDALLQRGQVGEAAHPILGLLLPLLGRADQGTGVRKELAEEAAREPRALRHGELEGEGTLRAQRPLDRLPRPAVFLLPIRILLHPGAERRLLGALLLEESGLHQRLPATLERLEGVLDPQELAHGDAPLLGAAVLELLEQAAVLGEEEEVLRQEDVALLLELGDGELAARPPRMAGDEDELPVARPLARPGQEVVGADGL